MKKKVLVVGAGLFGATYAHEMANKGYEIDVIEKRDTIGGNIYTYELKGIQVHKYGPHIFHTDEKYIWDYIQQFADFNHYINSPIANYYGEIYNLPFNMNTFSQMWNIKTPLEAQNIIDQQRKTEKQGKPENLEEQAISLIGTDIYEKLIKGYTEKQWMKKATELPPFIIRRVPVRMTYDNNYYNDRYQGIPIGGYTQIIERMLDHQMINVHLNTDFMENRQQYLEEYDTIIYTGKIDEFFDYRLGDLEYRSLRFETDVLDCENYQGNAVVNYTDPETPYTRIIEHKHFDFGKQAQTVITREYPDTYSREKEAYYPINNTKNNRLYSEYVKLSKEIKNVTFAGRLAQYRYYDMEHVIALGLKMTSKFE
ncbi:UDP-galactopyranose mutase [Marinilactibacillus kalidii]|uniref:UDP-galactopyranose mutase n=1 Tax=Marinilactibacillus kalidii TaxID=2820274 RepID=UPI001ABEE01C|nr:UDP-galactopyranose mutase [Marinilactibacillus kalidii]